MKNKIRKRIQRPATLEEMARHKQIRQQISEEKPELREWAQGAAARHKQRLADGKDTNGD